MIVSTVIGKLTDKVLEIINALSNRLTAADNWGPEGEVGQVLTSRGPRPTDPPPTFENIVDVLTAAATVIPGGISGVPGAGGGTGPAGPPGPSGGFMPLVIADGDTFTVPANSQALWAVPIIVDGTLIVDGVLVPVD